MDRLCIATILLIVFTAPTWAGLEDGIAAANRGDYETAIQEFKPLAEEGDAVAQTALGLMYMNGNGVPQNYAEAMKWFRKAAEQGYAQAQINLGIMYLKGTGVPQDRAKALSLFVQASGDDAMAQAYFEVVGYGVEALRAYVQDHDWLYAPQDDAEAVELYCNLATHGDDMAQNNLGIMYALGEGVPQDYVRAYLWLNLAARQGNENARIARDLVSILLSPGQTAEAKPQRFSLKLFGQRFPPESYGQRLPPESYGCPKSNSEWLQ